MHKYRPPFGPKGLDNIENAIIINHDLIKELLIDVQPLFGQDPQVEMIAALQQEVKLIIENFMKDNKDAQCTIRTR